MAMRYKVVCDAPMCKDPNTSKRARISVPANADALKMLKECKWGIHRTSKHPQLRSHWAFCPRCRAEGMNPERRVAYNLSLFNQSVQHAYMMQENAGRRVGGAAHEWARAAGERLIGDFGMPAPVLCLDDEEEAVLRWYPSTVSMEVSRGDEGACLYTLVLPPDLSLLSAEFRCSEYNLGVLVPTLDDCLHLARK
jgi:hypothetical protein